MDVLFLESSTGQNYKGTTPGTTNFMEDGSISGF